MTIRGNIQVIVAEKPAEFDVLLMNANAQLGTDYKSAVAIYDNGTNNAGAVFDVDPQRKGDVSQVVGNIVADDGLNENALETIINYGIVFVGSQNQAKIVEAALLENNRMYNIVEYDPLAAEKKRKKAELELQQ